MSRRSANIQIAFVTMVAAAALEGCSAQQAYHRDWQQCVDTRNVMVEDRLCDHPAGVGMPYYFYHWLYTPRPYYRGDTILGGYATPRPNMTVARSSTTSRGGFGSSAHGAGGGE